MVTMRWDVSDLLDLASDLAMAAGRIEPEAKPVVERTGLQVQGTAQVLVPVDTGLLKSSIELDTDRLSFVVGSGVEYAGYVEYGTSEMSPQPYLNPALDQHLPGFDQAIANTAVEVLR